VGFRIKAFGLRAGLVFVITCPAALAGGVSGYLPLNLEPEMERQIERVLILADEPILKRPIPVELVKVALPQACRVDKPLCDKVGRYLERYSRDYALTHASITGSASGGADVIIPNQYGLPNDSNWDLSLQGFVQPSDYLLLSTGVDAYQGRANPSAALTMGFNWAQFDVGYRPHWLSPMTDSSTLISTEAPTMPGVTLSNWEPLTRLGFQYEFALLKMDQTGKGNPPGDNILYQGVSSRGNPKIFTAQFSIEPFPGWSVGVNRLLQYGGGSGLPDSASFLLHDFFEPAGRSQTQGNQQASYVSRFIYPGKTPFAVYAQYAGEDNSDGGSYLLGNAALSVGIDFPRIWHHFDLTYEVSEWQNIWYVHNIFLDGTTNNGIVEGNWGAQERVFGDGVGARMQMLRIGWEPPFGGYLQERVRTVANENYYGGDSRQYFPGQPAPYVYHHYYDFTATYSHPWKDTTIGGELMYGRDIFGESFWRLSAFLRYGGDAKTRDDGEVEDESYQGGANPKGSEVFADIGINVNRVTVNLDPEIAQYNTPVGTGPHFALGARRAVSTNNDLGARVEIDEIQSHMLIGFRAVDWRYRFDGDAFAVGAFFGVNRYQLATPAYSEYAGLGAEWRNFLPWLPKWDLGLDFRHAQNIARDHVLPTDPRGSRPDSFYKIDSAVLYVSRHF
jgi:hypothetical protein